MKVAVIPARGGSKRIPLKNIKDFCGKPVIDYSIKAALDSKLFDEVIVSTDSDVIAEVALNCGAKVPFKRPVELSDDLTPTLPVIKHALESVKAKGDRPQFCCCIYPTAPFLTCADLREGFNILSQNAALNYVFSASRFEFPVQRALKHLGNGVAPMFSEFIDERSQDLEDAFHDAGQFYWGRADSFIELEPIFSDSGAPLFLPSYRVQDIDNEEDWRASEIKYETMRLRGEL